MFARGERRECSTREDRAKIRENQMAHEEYLRRNLLHAGSIGAVAGLHGARARLLAMKNPPKWMLKVCDSALDRARPLPDEIAQWRDTALDAPGYAVSAIRALK